LAIDDPLTLTVIVAGVIIACAFVIYAMRKHDGKEKKETTEEKPRELEGLPFKVVKSVPRKEASSAKDELRILDLEREILSDAIRRLYEAQAEGKITEQERDRLAQTYKTRMMTIKDAITRDESLVALHELETMQEDLIKLFSDRFTELTTKIDDLRSKVEVEPIKEVTIPTENAQIESKEDEEKPANEEEKAKRKRKPSAKPTPRTEAEKRIEEIRAEVEKVLDRLGQMEVES
jgi:MFS superfamily sulfate permease-like transporter